MINKLFIREFILVVNPYYSKNYFLNSLWFSLKVEEKLFIMSLIENIKKQLQLIGF